MPTIDLNKQATPQLADLRDIKISELEHRVDVLEHKLSELVCIFNSENSTCTYSCEPSETIKSDTIYQ